MENRASLSISCNRCASGYVFINRMSMRMGGTSYFEGRNREPYMISFLLPMTLFLLLLNPVQYRVFF